MSHEYQIDAVRVALTMQQTRAQIASINIANAGKTGASALRVDFANVESALRQAARATDTGESMQWLSSAERALRDVAMASTSTPINLDEQIAEMAAAGADYQVLTEALNRQFGLMRLATTGRS